MHRDEGKNNAGKSNYNLELLFASSELENAKCFEYIT